MATYAPTWTAEAQIEGAADGYTTLSGTTEEYSTAIDLTSHEGVQITVDVNFDATPTDNVIINIYVARASGDFATTDIPIYSLEIDSANDPSTNIPFIIRNATFVRIGCVQTGSTDSHDVRAYERHWAYTDA